MTYVNNDNTFVQIARLLFELSLRFSKIENQRTLSFLFRKKNGIVLEVLALF